MPRIATLSSVTNDRDDQDETPGEFPISDRVDTVRRQQPTESRDNLVYWEAQGKDRMCALHCLNTLLQGPVFTEVDLSTVALHLDDEERKLVYAASGSNQEVSELLSGTSHNAADDGFFSISVLEECLKRNDISITPTGAIRTVISNPTEEEGFVCNHHEHWFAIRKLYGHWYNLDSLKPAPNRVGEFYMSAFLYNLIDLGYNVFVIRSISNSHLPMPEQSSIRRPLNNNQFYLTDKQIDSLIRLDQEYHQKALKAETSKYGGNPSNNVPASSPSPNLSAGHSWPTEGGRSINEVQPLTSDLPSSTSLAIPDDDPELAEAIRLSMAEFVNSLPPPPSEPAVDSPDAFTIQIRLPNQQRVMRRFNDADPIKSIFHWLEFEQQSVIPSHTSYQLIAAFPRRLLRRIGRQSVEYESSDGQIDQDVNDKPLKDLFSSKQESLMLHLI